MLGHKHSQCDMDDIPAAQEKARAEAGVAPTKSGSVNMWCLMFDDGASLPPPGERLPEPVCSVPADAGGKVRGGAAAPGRGSQASLSVAASGGGAAR